jgi:hypothetical protein
MLEFVIRSWRLRYLNVSGAEYQSEELANLNPKQKGLQVVKSE